MPDRQEDPQGYKNECFFVALWYGQIPEAKTWLARGANPNHKDRLQYRRGYGLTPGQLVIEAGNTEFLELMLENKVDPSSTLIEVLNGKGSQAIVMAKLCIRYGAEIKDGKALYTAVDQNNLEKVNCCYTKTSSINWLYESERELLG